MIISISIIGEIGVPGSGIHVLAGFQFLDRFLE